MGNVNRGLSVLEGRNGPVLANLLHGVTIGRAPGDGYRRTADASELEPKNHSLKLTLGVILSV